MRLTDTNSKGMVVFQTKRGTYVALKPEELNEAIESLIEAQVHLNYKRPRKVMDSRKY